jgi:hypothetical protein
MIKPTQKRLALLTVFILLVSVLGGLVVKPVEAANLTRTIIRPDRMAISLSTSYLILVKPATANATKVIVTFPSGYDVTGAAATTTGVPTSYNGASDTITAFPNLGTATVSGQDVTIPTTSGTLSTSNTYGVYLTTIVNPGTTGQKTFTVVTEDGSSATLDTSSAVVYIVSDNGTATDSDQIVITASVSPSFQLDLGANSDSVTTSLGSVANGTGVTATVKTNAQNGYVVFMKSANTLGLHSATTNTDIAFAGSAGSVYTLSSGTEGFVIDVDRTTNTSGAAAVDTAFDGSTTSEGGVPDTSYRRIFYGTAPVGGAGDVATIIPRVAISATTKAANDYTQTLTVAGAGNF